MPEITSSHPRDEALLAQIERDILDRGVPLSDVLLKCVALSGNHEYSWLRDWARNELNGYTSRLIPAYRVVGATLCYAYQHYIDPARPPALPQPLPPDIGTKLDNRVYIYPSIHQLEDFASQAAPIFFIHSHANFQAVSELLKRVRTTERLPFGTSPDILLMLTPITVALVLTRIRTDLTGWIGDIRSQKPANHGIPSSFIKNEVPASATPGAVSIAVSKSNLYWTQGSSGVVISQTNPPATEAPGSRAWAVIGWILAFLIAAIGTYAGLGQWLQWPAPWR